MSNIFKKGYRYKIVIHLFFILMCLTFVVPMILVISISFSSEASVTAVGAGYSLIPKEFSLEAYQLAFANPKTVTYGYIVTISQSFLGTFLSCIVMGMVAYPLSRSNFAYKGVITFIVFFTMLFGGGMIPTYIVYTQFYGLRDNFLVYILPGLAGGAYYTLIVRTFFKGLPESLFESAKIDGARELTIFFRIAVPLSKPVFATVAFMMLVAKWNDFQTSMIYITNQNLYTLQYLLQRILNEAQYLNGLMSNPIPGVDVSQFKQPAETLRYAMCVIAAGPMLLIFPFFQKYFATGLTIGAVKG
ncbi:MAG: carbohydrate ABC transporter permease [Clostridia bacterium]|jgi:ABC transporter, permease protein|uniref:Carbohydrate ABC transporter permease n=1 Tax=Bianquea renquensis TaxID=2763661 RepID=A0A926DUV5_9FIRM|nr:carbohydrate ABC transporter permease [Bianquea renquensis]MBC8543794.1 carbohydrate ABC transporter permease [Bianquea renquensis]